MDIYNRLLELQDSAREEFKVAPRDAPWRKIPFVGRYLEQHKDNRLVLLPALLFDVEDLYFERITKDDYKVRGYFSARLYVDHICANEKWDEGPVLGIKLLDEVIDFLRKPNTSSNSAAFFRPYSVTRFHENWGSATNARRDNTLKVRQYDIWIIKLEVSWREKIGSGDSSIYALPIGQAVIGKNFVIGGNPFIDDDINIGDASSICVDALTANGVSVSGLKLDKENRQIFIKI